MVKPLKSPWNFGELFPPETLRRVFTVTELTTTVKRLLEKEIGRVWVTGEISNLRAQSSGHFYFSIKDASAQLSCVLFRGEAPSVDRPLLQDGRKVILQGELTVYEARGQYQLRVLQLELQGIGALQAAFERLKQKLQAEGLFARERKRPLPRHPQRIGIVTSPSGAAWRDVLHVVRRRQPGLEIILAGCRVQGAGAAAEIAGAIRLLNEWAAGSATGLRRPPVSGPGKLDLILVTRGGGSLEDLWAFNEERVARAIFDSAVPVVSAVGHEIDFTISDFVADLRAATPSAAAEIITEGAMASRQFIAEAAERLQQLARQRLDWDQGEWQQLAQRLARVHPRRDLHERWQLLDDWQTGLVWGAKRGWRGCQTNWLALQQRLLRVRPAQILAQRAERFLQARRQLQSQARLGWEQWHTRLKHAEGRLRLLSPMNVLERGYSITSDAASGNVIRSAGEVRPGQRLQTRLQSGQIRSVVESESEGGS